ncbi:MAG: Gfo/Idh/MocA family oxidoreductase [bacterium]|nr:Gfo/Idh/MocA family oxidoreductase [bacterium]
MKETIRVGIIGLGGISRVHAAAYRGYGDNAILVSGADPDTPARKKFHETFGINAYVNYKEMLASEDLDAVSVCVPNFLHARVALDCLDAHCNVYCEKPPAINELEVMDMIEAAKKKDLLLMWAFNNRYRPEAQLIKRLIDMDDGITGIGNIYQVSTSWRRRNGIPMRGGWFTKKAESGGGSLIDLGVHVLDLAMWVLDYPKIRTVVGSVGDNFGRQKSHNGPWGKPDSQGLFNVEDYASAFITTTDGCAIKLESSWASHREGEQVALEILGMKGSLKMNRKFRVEGDDNAAVDRLRFYHDNGEAWVDEELHVTPDPAMGRIAGVRHFVDCVQDRELEPVVKPEEGYQLMCLLRAIYASAEKGEAIQFSATA